MGRVQLRMHLLHNLPANTIITKDWIPESDTIVFMMIAPLLS
jgi:hypothetical protein